MGTCRPLWVVGIRGSSPSVGGGDLWPFRRHWCDGGSLSSDLGIMCAITVARHGPLARHVKHGGAVGMDNTMRYDGVLVYGKLTVREFASSKHPQVLPFGIPGVEASIGGWSANVKRQS